MKSFKITLYIACVVVGIQLPTESTAYISSLSACNRELDTCQSSLNSLQANYNSAQAALINATQILGCLSAYITKSESCDLMQNNLECAAGKAIHILQAFYGFIPNHICNTDQYTDSCAVARDTVMSWTSAYEGAQNCVIAWDNNREDPCQGTSKVLVIYYLCVDRTLG